MFMSTENAQFVVVDGAADHSEVTIEIRPAVKYFRLTAASCENLVQFLGGVRKTLLPTISEIFSYQSGAPLKAERSFNIAFGTEQLGDVLLHMGDVRFGWLSYVLTREEAKRLGQKLIDLADGPRSDIAKH